MPSTKNEMRVLRVEDETGRQMALRVMGAIYRDEKGWIQSDEKLVSSSDLSNEAVSWFVAFVEDRPVGVLRVLYEVPLDLYRQYGFKLLARGLDLERFLNENQIAEIGRFAVLPQYRGNLLVVVALMRAAVADTVRRGWSHYITDIFEGEQHSPHGFHTRVMGFQEVATHDVGELNCPNRRITMVLDLKHAYSRLRAQNNWIFRYVTEGWTPEMHARLGGGPRAMNELVSA
jgi:hypothetical protein